MISFVTASVSESIADCPSAVFRGSLQRAAIAGCVSRSVDLSSGIDRAISQKVSWSFITRDLRVRVH